jgi:hypothetical protein
MKIIHPISNYIKQLEQIQIEIGQTEDKATNIALAIKAAEMVLPIFEYYYPKDKRVRNSIEAAKRGEYNAGAFDAYYDYAAVAAYAAAYAATATYAAAYAAYAAAAAANITYVAASAEYAIKATKEHFKLAK